MAVKTLANIAAAVAAGYTETVLDRGASFSPAANRFEVLLEKQLTGEPNAQASVLFRAFGQGANQAAAEAVALAALISERQFRYGTDVGTTSTGPHSGAHTLDAT